MLEAINGVHPRVTETIKRMAGIAELAQDQDFYDAGLTSIASLNLLIELEENFKISIPDDRFAECRTVNDLSTLIEELRG